MLFELFSCTFHVEILSSCLLLFIVYVCVFFFVEALFCKFISKKKNYFFHHHDHHAAIYGTIVVGMATCPTVVFVLGVHSFSS